MKKLFIFIAINTLLIILFKADKANAQGVDLGIYPPIFQINTTPPSDIKVPFFIQNYTDSSTDLTIYLKPFTAATSENGQISYLSDTSSYSDQFLPNRIQVLDDNGDSIDSLTLSPKQKQDLTLHLQIPSNEPKGEYYLSLIFSSNAGSSGDNNVSLASGGIASNILLSIGPLGKTQGVIQEFSSPFFVTQGPVPFTLRFKNTSDHYLTPTGGIVITNMFNQTIGKINFLPVNVLSNTVRRIPDSLQSPTVSQKDYEKIKAVVEKSKYPVAIWPEKFLLGPYTATLTLSLSDSGPVFTRRISFFAVPLEYIIGVILIIGMVVFIILRVKKKIKFNYK